MYPGAEHGFSRQGYPPYNEAAAALLGACGGAVLPRSASAQSEEEWVDPAATNQMTDIGDVVARSSPTCSGRYDPHVAR